MLNNDPIPDILLRDRKGTKKGNEINFLCLVHDDHNPSANYNLEKKAWNCFACGASGGYIDLMKLLGIYKTNENNLISYEIRDINNNLIATKNRSDNGTGKKYWIEPKGVKNKELPLYNTEKIPTYSKDEPLFIVEGEKCAESLTKIGFQALGTITGASSIPNREVFEPVLDFTEIYLIPDNDDAGYKHMTSIKQYLPKSYMLDKWIDKPEKYDIADFIAKSNNPDNDIKNLVSELSYRSYTSSIEPKPTPLKEGGVGLGSHLLGIKTSKEFLETPVEKINYIVDDLLTVGGTSNLVSAAKLGKTHFMLTLAHCVANGLPFLDRPTKKGKVLFIELEGRPESIKFVIQNASINSNNNLWFHGTKKKLQMESFIWLEKAIKEHNPDLVIIDTIWKFIPEAIENVNNYDITTHLMPIEELANQTNTHISVTMHSNKNPSKNENSTLGSSGINANFDTNMLLFTDETRRRKFKITGSRDGNETESGQETVIEQSDNGLVYLGGLAKGFTNKETWEKVKNVLSDKGKINKSTLQDELRKNHNGFGSNTLDHVLNSKVEQRELNVERLGQGKPTYYWLPEPKENQY